MSKSPKGTQPPVDADGKQNVLGKRQTPEQGFEELKKAKRFGRLPCWPHLVPKLKPIDSKQPSKGNMAVLECSQCEADLRPSNISNISSNHFNSEGICKKAAAMSSKVSNSKPSSSKTASSSNAADKGIEAYLAPAKNQRKALEKIAMYLAVRGNPSHVEDPHLQEAFAALGCTLMHTNATARVQLGGMRRWCCGSCTRWRWQQRLRSRRERRWRLLSKVADIRVPLLVARGT